MLKKNCIQIKNSNNLATLNVQISAISYSSISYYATSSFNMLMMFLIKYIKIKIISSHLS